MGQAFGLALEIFGLAALIALLVALVLTWLARRLTPAGYDGYFVLTSAVAIAYFAGYAMLPRSWAAFIPQANQSWQWLPYLGLAAAAFAASLPPSHRSPAWKLAIVAVAPMAGAALAPTWPVFGFGRGALQWFVVIYLLVVGVPLQHLPARMLNQWLLGLLCFVATAVAVAIGAFVSTRLAQLGALAAAALAGSWIAGFVGPRQGESPLRSLIPVFTVLVGGITFVASVEPDPPQAGLLAIPLLPLVLWLPPALGLHFARGKIG
jgi:hypothetical protein